MNFLLRNILLPNGNYGAKFLFTGRCINSDIIKLNPDLPWSYFYEELSRHYFDLSEIERIPFPKLDRRDFHEDNCGQ